MDNLFRLILGIAGMILVISSIGSLFMKTNSGLKSNPQYSMLRLDAYYSFVPLMIGIGLILKAIT
jgi:hypothetical protein